MPRAMAPSGSARWRCACARLGLLIFIIGSAWILLPAAFVLGLAYGPATPASSLILARVTPPRLLNVVFSIKQTGVPLGGIIAGAIVAPLVVFVGWQAAALALAGACLVLARGIAAAARQARHRAAERRMPSLRQLFRPLKTLMGMPELRRLSLISIAFSAIQVCLSTYLVIFLIEHNGAGLIAAGLVLTVTQLAGVGGRIFWGSVADWTRRPRLLLAILGVAMTMGAIGISFVDKSWPQEALLALMVFFGGTAIGWNGVFLAEVARLAGPAKAGEITGATAVFTFAGPLLGPSLFSLILLLHALLRRRLLHHGRVHPHRRHPADPRRAARTCEPAAGDGLGAVGHLPSTHIPSPLAGEG